METELKLTVSQEDVATLASAMPVGIEASERDLVSTYFDTSEAALWHAGFTLRVRGMEGRRVQTVKAERGPAAGVFARPEWEREIEGDAPSIDASAGPIAGLVEGQRLTPRFVTEVRRTSRVLDWQGARIEAALDVGAIRAGDASQPLAELELELRAGPVPALFDLARVLNEAASLRIGVQSKAERGHALVHGEAVAAAKAEPIALDPDDDAVRGFSTIAQACLRQFRLNEAILLTPNDGAAALHQARVGLRRLRSALSLFKSILDSDLQAGRFAAGLKDLAAALGEVRDLDVLIERHDGVVRTRLIEARIEAFGRVRDKLDAADTRRLMLDLAEWLAVGDWRVMPADPSLAHAPITPFAADILDRRRKRLKRKGKHLRRLDDHDRHRVRIEAKKLRYAAEFFASLWPKAKARRHRQAFAESIEQLQDELGRMNDRSQANAVLARLGLGPTHSDRPDEARSVNRAEAIMDQLLVVKRFWR